MSVESDDEEAALEAAKLAILKQIPTHDSYAKGTLPVLYLAMAYTVLNNGKLPGDVPKPPR